MVFDCFNDGVHRLMVKRVNVTLALPLTGHEVAPYEWAEVVAHHGLFLSEFFDQFAYAHWSFIE